ncbi:MAG: HAD-IA family hydrolase [Chitinophagales bacterium]|nr:HAD-IA family hydrolase [Chitinophagales bacterium]
MNKIIIPPTIDTLIFDLGNVILQLTDDKYWEQEIFGKLFYQEDLKSLRTQHFFEHFECGKITEQVFLNTLKEKLIEPMEDETLIQAWNLRISYCPKENIEQLQALKDRYSLFLLSNTNIIHERYFLHILENEFGYPVFDEVFEQCFYSHHMGMRKPNKEIYTGVLNATGKLPEKCCFFDDMPENLLAPAELGLEVVLITSTKDILSI